MQIFDTKKTKRRELSTLDVSKPLNRSGGYRLLVIVGEIVLFRQALKLPNFTERLDNANKNTIFFPVHVGRKQSFRHHYSLHRNQLDFERNHESGWLHRRKHQFHRTAI